LHRDGRSILCERSIKEIYGKIKGSLKNANYQDSILNVFSVEKVIDRLFPIQSEDNKINKTRDKLDGYLNHLKTLAIIKKSEPNKYMIKEIENIAPKLKSNLIKELVEQKLNGFYFFPKIESDGNDLGYVALLREIKYLPSQISYRISEGLSQDDYRTISSDLSIKDRLLDFNCSDLAMPVSIIESPFIEHFMQSLTMLFSRIGLQDTSEDYIKVLWNRQPSLKEV
jgi:hypothetical protein